MWEFQIADDGTFEIWEYDRNHHFKTICTGKAKVSVVVDIELNFKKGKANPAQRNAISREITRSLDSGIDLRIDKVVIRDKRK